jgi:hypothetical protein
MVGDFYFPTDPESLSEQDQKIQQRVNELAKIFNSKVI